MAKKSKAPAAGPDIVLQLDPSEILADNNIRHELREGDVDRMIASIIDRGGIQEPVSVELIADAKKGEPQYALIKGFIRHAAASKMNASGGDIKVPALVRSPIDSTDRLKTQVAENVVRQSLSPIDTALSIQKLLDAGVSKTEIRSIFARAGSSKGATVSPMSNAWVNNHLNMLQLPAEIIARIHNGEVSAEAAVELAKVPEERREAVLESALEAVKKLAAREEREENQVLKAEQTEAKKEEAAKKLAADLEQAKVEAADAAKLVEEKQAAVRVAAAAPYDPAVPEDKKAHDETVAAAETDYKAAKSLDKKLKNKLAKLMGEKSAAQELKEKLAKARQTAAVGPTAIKKAAQADKDTPAGAAAAQGSAPVALTAGQIRDGVKDMAKSNNPLVSKVIGIFSDFCKGVLTPKLALADLEKALKLKAPAPAPK